MKSKPRAKASPFSHEIIVTRGKPSAVIIPLDEYRDMLARLEDAEDLKILKRLKKNPLRFRSLDTFLKKATARV